MKFVQTLVLSLTVPLAACTALQARKPATAPMVPPKPITVPVSKNWKVIEQAPNLTDERGHVPFQTEQSVLPAGVSPVVPTVGATPEAPADHRKLQTPP